MGIGRSSAFVPDWSESLNSMCPPAWTFAMPVVTVRTSLANQAHERVPKRVVLD
jgi:hypothetical protein